MSGTVLFQTAYLGDAVLTLPLVEAIAERFGAPDVLATPYAAPVFQTHRSVRRVIMFDKRRAGRGLGGMLGVATRLRAERYDRAYLAHGSIRSAVLAFLSGAPERIGFRTSPGAPLYTRRVDTDARIPEYRRLLALALQSGIDDSTAYPPPRIMVPERVALSVTELLKRSQVASEFIALAPGSVWPTKRWPFFRELALKLEAMRPVVIIGGPGEQPLFTDPVTGSGRCIDLTGELSVIEAAALIERAAYLVANDSAPLHIANAVETPVVAIFGPTAPDRGYGPRGQADRVMERTDLSCRPCSTHGGRRCPLGHHDCMRRLTVEAVFEEIRNLEKGLDLKCA